MEQGETARRDYLRHAAIPKWGLDLAFLASFFDIHVFEFAGLEDFAALLALDELRILVSADNLHARVLAGLLHITYLRRGRLERHKSGRSPTTSGGGMFFAGISRYFRPALPVVKSPTVTPL
jgi:hypothetical protein